jgi:membrane-bound lytic murein transglycosylase MltF
VDERQHAFQTAIDFIVPETQCAKAFAGKMSVTLRVAPGMRIEIMLAAIDLDNAAVLKAVEVYDMAIAGSLSTEMKPLFSA